MSERKPNEYALINFKRDSEPEGTLRFQPIVFFKLNEDGTFENGTTIEEMLRVSIERLQDLNGRFSCNENLMAISKMTEALIWLNMRTENRIKRGVEGKLRT